MREAMLFGTSITDGKKSLHGLIARVAVPIGPAPDVVIHQGKLFVFHYEGMELYYRLASTYHYQKSAVMVDGVEINREDSNAHLFDHSGGSKPGPG